MKMKDFYLVAIIGFLVGALILLPVANLGFQISPSLVFASVLGFGLFAPIALLVLKRLARFWSVFEQFGKFAAVGTLNTLIDIGILNVLLFATGIAVGASFSAFKGISFLAATTNSYFWNKFWTFQNPLPVSVRQYLRFAFFALFGMLINVGTASFLVNWVGAPKSMTPAWWANVSALIAVGAAFLWNFLSYRYIVFSTKGGSAFGRKSKILSVKSSFNFVQDPERVEGQINPNDQNSI